MSEKEPFRTHEELKNTVEILEQKCEVLLTHIVGEKCPSCGEHKVVEGCIKGCLACDWKESIDGDGLHFDPDLVPPIEDKG